MSIKRAAMPAMAVVAALLLVLAPATALAQESDENDTGSGSVAWAGHGSDSIDEECPEGVEPFLHWVLTPGGPFALSNAELTVEGDTYQGERRSETGEHGAIHFDTDYYEGAEEGELDASATFDWERTGEGGPDEPDPNLVISEGCPAPPEPEPEVTVVFAKAWTVDDDDDLFVEGEVDAWLTVDGTEVDFGQTIDVTDQQGETLLVEEHLDETTLPEECTWEGSDLDELDLTVPTATDEDVHHEITITNEITCVLDEAFVDDEVEVRDEVFVDDEVEVLDDVEVRAEAEELPVTGAQIPALLIAGLLSLALGSGLLTRRRS